MLQKECALTRPVQKNVPKCCFSYRRGGRKNMQVITKLKYFVCFQHIACNYGETLQLAYYCATRALENCLARMISAQIVQNKTV